MVSSAVWNDAVVLSNTVLQACTVEPILAEAIKTVSHSTAITQALTLEIVVSVACHNSIPANCGESEVASQRTLLAELAVKSSTSPVPAVLLPSILLVAICCIFANVTASSAMVVAKEPVPVPVTSQVRVIVWSPVFVPVTEAVSATVSVLGVVPAVIVNPTVSVDTGLVTFSSGVPSV